MSISVSNCNLDTLDATAKLKENLNYIEKFGLPISVAQYIDFCLIFHNVHIDDFITTSDIEINL